MKTFYDYATNAACPQRPVWQITPVGYKWAQSVLQERNSHCVRGVKKELKPRQFRKIFGKMLVSLFRRCQVMRMEESTFGY
jgi:hypothetical protein